MSDNPYLNALLAGGATALSVLSGVAVTLWLQHLRDAKERNETAQKSTELVAEIAKESATAIRDFAVAVESMKEILRGFSRRGR